MGPYAKLLGFVSGPNPTAVSCHGSPASVGRAPFTPSSISSRSRRRGASSLLFGRESSTCQVNRPCAGRAASKGIGPRVSSREYLGGDTPGGSRETHARV